MKAQVLEDRIFVQVVVGDWKKLAVTGTLAVSVIDLDS